MSIYYCHRCQRYQDNDYVICIEDPKEAKTFGLMCEEHLLDDGEEE